MLVVLVVVVGVGIGVAIAVVVCLLCLLFVLHCIVLRCVALFEIDGVLTVLPFIVPDVAVKSCAVFGVAFMTFIDSGFV